MPQPSPGQPSLGSRVVLSSIKISGIGCFKKRQSLLHISHCGLHGFGFRVRVVLRSINLVASCEGVRYLYMYVYLHVDLCLYVYVYVCVCVLHCLCCIVYSYMHAGSGLWSAFVQARNNLCLLDVLFASEQTNLWLNTDGVLDS